MCESSWMCVCIFATFLAVNSNHVGHSYALAIRFEPIYRPIITRPGHAYLDVVSSPQFESRFNRVVMGSSDHFTDSDL